MAEPSVGWKNIKCKTKNCKRSWASAVKKRHLYNNPYTIKVELKQKHTKEAEVYTEPNLLQFPLSATNLTTSLYIYVYHMNF